MAGQISFTGAQDVLDFYFSDLDHRAEHVVADVDDGNLVFEPQARPLALHVLIAVPSFGHVWVTADNGGEGYQQAGTWSLTDELAMSRIRQCERRLLELQLEEPPDESFEAAWDFFDLGRPIESLQHGLVAGEELEHAAALFALEIRDVEAEPLPRIGANLFGDRLGEYSISSGDDWHTPLLQPNFLLSKDRWELMADICDATTIPNYWRWVEFSEGRQRWAGIEEILAFCDERRIAAKSFSLFWPGIGGLPPWVRNLSFEDLLSAVENWVDGVVRRLRGRVSCWELAGDLYGGTFARPILSQNREQTFQMVRRISQIVGDLDPGTPRIVSLGNPWGEYVQTNGRDTSDPLSLVDSLCDTDIEFEGIGLQMNYAQRDLMTCAAQLDRLAGLGRPIWLTESGAPSKVREKEMPSQLSVSTTAWRGPWEQGNQGAWIEMLYVVAMARPYIKNITYSDLDDERSRVPHAGLLDMGGVPKAAYERIIELCQTYGVGGPANLDIEPLED